MDESERARPDGACNIYSLTPRLGGFVAPDRRMRLSWPRVTIASRQEAARGLNGSCTSCMQCAMQRGADRVCIACGSAAARDVAWTEASRRSRAADCTWLCICQAAQRGISRPGSSAHQGSRSQKGAAALANPCNMIRHMRESPQSSWRVLPQSGGQGFRCAGADEPCDRTAARGESGHLTGMLPLTVLHARASPACVPYTG